MLSGSLEFPEIEAIYARFSALTAWRAELGGALLLYSGLAAEGVAVAMAANIAGAASLGLEPDAARAKAALRAGVCDFVVNSLDESLRILKNEIRQHRAVSVVLTGDGEAAVREMVARGVQPDVLAFAVPEFEQRGAWSLAAKMDDARIAVVWCVDEAPRVHLPRLDALAAQVLQVQDARVRWLDAGPRYLGRAFAGQRYLRMSGAEADAFVAGVRGAALPVAVTVVCDGRSVVIGL